jgi:hypothetical protein
LFWIPETPTLIVEEAVILYAADPGLKTIPFKAVKDDSNIDVGDTVLKAAISFGTPLSQLLGVLKSEPGPVHVLVPAHTLGP